MKKLIAGLILSCLSIPAYAVSYGDTDQDIAVLAKGDTIGTYSGSGTITTTSGGAGANAKIGTMTDNTVFKNILDYIEIGEVKGNAKIENMEAGKIETLTAGTIETIKNNSYITNMNGGYIETLTTDGGSTYTPSIANMNGGTIETVSGKGKVVNLNTGAAIAAVTGNGRVEVLKGGTIGTMDGNASIGTLKGNGAGGKSVIGTVKGNAVINNVYAEGGSEIESLEGSARINTIATYAVITINEMKENASIGSFGKGIINKFLGGTVEILTGAGTITTADGTSAKVTDMNAGKIIDLKNGATVGTLSGTGAVTTVSAGGKITVMNGGTVGTVTDQAVIGTLSGTGRIESLSNGGTVTTMNGTNAFIKKAEGENTAVGQLIGGTIETVTDKAVVGTLSGSGKITTLSGGASVTNMNSYAAEIGTVTGENTNVGTLSGGRIINATDKANIGTLTSSGQIQNLWETASVTNMSGGQIDNLYGTVQSLNGWGYIGTMHNGIIAAMTDYTRINTMNGGTVNAMTENAYVSSMNGGTIKKMDRGAYVYSMTDGTVGEMTENASVRFLFGNGTVDEMDGNAYVNSITGGRINTMKGGSFVQILSGTGVIDEMTDASYLTNMNGGTVNTFDSTGTITNLNSGKIGSFDKGTIITLDMNNVGGIVEIGNLRGGTIGTIKTPWSAAAQGGLLIREMSGGTIGNINLGYIPGLNVTIGEMTGGSITSIYGAAAGKGSAYIGLLDGGSIGALTAWGDGTFVVDEMRSGDIGQLSNAVRVNNLTGGRIENVIESSRIVNMSGGTIGILNGYSENITNLSGGTIEIMKQYSKIGSSGTGSMTGGIIKEMQEESVIHADMTGGTVEKMSDLANIKHLAGGTVNEMNDNTVIERMSAGKVKKMKDNAYIGLLSGGFIGDVGTTNWIDTIIGGTIYGNIAAGQDFTVSSGGSLSFVAETVGNELDRAVNAEANAYVFVKDYLLTSNVVFNMAADSTLAFGGTDIDVPQVVFAGNGKLVLADGMDVFTNAVIQDFSAGGTVTFEMFVDEAAGGQNDVLKIISNTGTENNHLIAVGSHHSSTDNRTPIRLITDETGSMSFKLTHGDLVGLGAQNYYLSSVTAGTGKLWELLLEGSLTDQAKVIASVATANLTSVYSLQNALHKRMGDIRYLGESGMWARTYTNQTSFSDWAKTSVRNYGAEIGIDKNVIQTETGNLSVGLGFGINYADTKVKTHYSIDGGAETMMPYVGLYGTWARKNGLYLDAILRYAFNRTDGHYYDGANHKQGFEIKNHIANASMEIGYQHKITERLTLEPRAELSYTLITADSFVDDAMYGGKYEDTMSLLGNIGVLARYDMGRFKPFAKIGVAYEFDGSTDIVYDTVKFNTDIKGTRLDFGLGIAGQIKDKLNFFSEIDVQTGQQSYRNINLNIGLRWDFGKQKGKTSLFQTVDVVNMPEAPKTQPTKKPEVLPWYIQVTATYTEDAAMEYWNDLKERVESLKDYEPTVIPTSLDFDKALYMLRIGPFETLEKAEDYCTVLKKHGNECYVPKYK